MFRHTARRHNPAAAAAPKSTPRALELLIRAVADKRVALDKPDDIFKLCVTSASRDGAALGLLEDKPFATALRDSAAAVQASFSPFQLTQVKSMCTKAGLELEAAKQPQSQQEQHQQAANVANEIPPAPAPPQAATTAKTHNLWDETTATTTAPTEAGDGVVAAADSEHRPFQVDDSNPAQLQEVVDALHAVRRSFDERGTYSLRQVQAAVDLLPALLPHVTAQPLLHIIMVLAHINFQDYTLAQRLSRRACELCSSMSIHECCRVLSRLYKLRVQDSLAVIVKRIEREARDLSMYDMTLVISAAHQHPHVTAALQPLVGRTLYELSGRVGEKQLSAAQIATCVDVAAKYGMQNNPSVRAIVEGAARRAGELPDRLLATLLQSAHALQMITPEVFEPLSRRAVELCRTMDVRYLEPMLDVFSLLPFNSAPFMDGVLVRLADDAGKLQVNHLVSVLELVSSYPGARGSTAVPALAFAAVMRKDLLDPHGVVTALVSLAQLQQFSDEFFQLFEFLLAERKGFRNGADVAELLSHVPPPSSSSSSLLTNADHQRLTSLVARSLAELVPALSKDDALEMQNQLLRLKMDGGGERALMRRIAARLESLSVEQAAQARVAAQETLTRRTGWNDTRSSQQAARPQTTAEMEWEQHGAAAAHHQQDQHQQHQSLHQHQQQQKRGGGISQQLQRQKQQQQQQQQQQQSNKPKTKSAAAPLTKKKPFDLRKAQLDFFE